MIYTFVWQFRDNKHTANVPEMTTKRNHKWNGNDDGIMTDYEKNNTVRRVKNDDENTLNDRWKWQATTVGIFFSSFVINIIIFEWQNAAGRKTSTLYFSLALADTHTQQNGTITTIMTMKINFFFTVCLYSCMQNHKNRCWWSRWYTCVFWLLWCHK